jgi:hypothetical protein
VESDYSLIHFGGDIELAIFKPDLKSVLNGAFSESWRVASYQGIVFFEFRFRFLDISGSLQHCIFLPITFLVFATIKRVCACISQATDSGETFVR